MPYSKFIYKFNSIYSLIYLDKNIRSLSNANK
jgi:hypothetical protein